jgi:hypothetical protein
MHDPKFCARGREKIKLSNPRRRDTISTYAVIMVETSVFVVKRGNPRLGQITLTCE